jgi:hypothetical protein
MRKTHMVLPMSLALSACAGSGHFDRGMTAGSAGALNAGAETNNGRVVYVTGYLHTGGHPWEFGISDHRRTRDAECLNLDAPDFLTAHRKQFDGKRVTLKGEFRHGDWAGAWAGCDNGNGLIIDETDLRARYRVFDRAR